MNLADEYQAIENSAIRMLEVLREARREVWSVQPYHPDAYVLRQILEKVVREFKQRIQLLEMTPADQLGHRLTELLELCRTVERELETTRHQTSGSSH